MPKRIPIKEKRPFFFAYRLGTDENGETRYGGLHYSKGQFVDSINNLSSNAYGDKLDYDAYLLFEKDDETKYIDEFTKIWVYALPTSSMTLPDFKILKCGRPTDGIITLYVKSLAQNHDAIWYEYDGEIFETNVDFNKAQLEVVIPNNMYLPIDETTKVWYVQPSDNAATNGLLQLLSRESREQYTVLKFREL